MRHTAARLVKFLRKTSMNEITQLLHAMDEGNHQASEELMAIVYDELHQLALSKLARESPGHTLQPTALVHEAYMRLLPPARETPDESAATREQSHSTKCDGKDDSTDSHQRPNWQSRAHFFGAAAEAMRRVLIDSARKKQRVKRGGDRSRVDLGEAELAIQDESVDLLELDEALSKLESADPEKAQIVKLRYFAGLSLEETAAALNVSVSTVHRKWRFARAWLKRQIEKDT